MARPIRIFAYMLMISLMMSSPLFAVEAEDAWKNLNLEARGLLEQKDVEGAVKKAEESLKFAKEKLGEKSPNVMKSLNNLGVIYFIAGDLAKAQMYYQQAVEFSDAYLGKDHLFVADTLVNLSKLNHQEGRYGETVSNLEKALKIREKNLKENDPQIAAVLAMLGQVYYEMGLADEAKAMMVRLKKIT